MLARWLVYSCPNPSVSLHKCISEKKNNHGGWKKGDALDREAEFTFQTLVILVRWQIEAIEARMAAREAIRISALLDRESPRSIAAL